MTQRTAPPSDNRANDGDNSRVGVIIVAAGASQRMMGRDMKPRDKIFEPLLGRPVISHTISVFEECPLVYEIVLVLGEHNLGKGRSLAAVEGWKKLKHVCLGGQRRQDSVKAGLQHISQCEWVMVHDGARPCVTQEIIRLGLEKVLETGAAVPAIAVNDTMKKVSADGTVQETLQRESLRAVQTPQVFHYDLLQEAYRGDPDGVTDDASLVERLGHSVKVFTGSAENIKITTQVDLYLAEAIFKSRADS
ncbi:MAG: 2-C-methyl-D-erythritol 4-phosphate cytidylyltransferase [Chloroflexi bacterium]|nr:2-C-methyl-D-erythritol 4-phosphate cytidylyltransferase [Chloroflexota bacterium]